MASNCYLNEHTIFTSTASPSRPLQTFIILWVTKLFPSVSSECVFFWTSTSAPTPVIEAISKVATCIDIIHSAEDLVYFSDPPLQCFFEVREMEDFFLFFNLSVTGTIFSRNQHERKYLLASHFPSAKLTCSGKISWETHFQKVLSGYKMVVIRPWLSLDVLRGKEGKSQVFILMIQR